MDRICREPYSEDVKYLKIKYEYSYHSHCFVADSFACQRTEKKTVVNDSNTPLHLLQPAYQGTYGDLTPEQVKKEVDRVFAYIDKETPARVVDKNTGKVITNYTTMGEEAQLERGAFRLASYEWGVTYSALIAASEATGDTRYMDYVQNRFRFLVK